MEDIFEKILEKVKGRMGTDHLHGVGHVLRVYYFATKFGEKLHADMDVLKAAALLHDIARPLEDDDPNIDHATLSAEIAKSILEEVGFPKEKIEEVLHAIRSHRFKKGEKPKTLEAKILQDADRLDALGAMGIFRTIYWSGTNKRSVEDTIKHFEEKILKLPELMNTEPGKRMAEERVKIVSEFVQALRAELRRDSR